MKTLSTALRLSLAGLVAAASPAAAADDIADYYKGRTVTVVVGYSAGGGADLWARFFSRHIGNHIPGKPNVIVQNLTGGSGFRAISYVYGVGPQDGTHILLPTVAISTAKALGMPNVDWDTLKLNWLGNLTKDAQSCVASGRSGIRSIREAAKRQIIFGSDGASNSTGQHPKVLSRLFDYKVKIVTGYGGTSQVRLAMETGEVEAVCSLWASSALGPQRGDMESGKLVPIVQMGSSKHAIFGAAPTVYELTESKEDRMLMRFVFGPGEISRPYGVGPGVSADRVAALRAAFWAAANSPELKADAAKNRLFVNPMDWKETVAAFRAVLDVPETVVARAREMIGR
jgi:tripartite-type tricarboxylate transporter receptor subunit TctC